jgi:Fe-S-cluster containining protein
VSLCDRCFDPGRCCQDLVLSRSDGHQLTVWADEDPAAQLADRIGPHWFEPIAVQGEWVDEDAGRTHRSHRWACRALGPGGRCTVYDERPQLCRDFEAGSDPLCVHWRGAEGGEG